MEPVKKIIVSLLILTTANLMNGAADNQVDLDNQLLEAAKHKDTQVVTNLLDMGANVNAVGSYKHTPLHNAVRNNKIGVARLLLDRGANPNAVDRLGSTPILYAALQNNPDMTKLLLERGGSLTHKESKAVKRIANQTGFFQTANVIQSWEDAPTVKGALDEDN